MFAFRPHKFLWTLIYFAFPPLKVNLLTDELDRACGLLSEGIEAKQTDFVEVPAPLSRRSSVTDQLRC